jgi:hypothetical protein
MAADYDLFHLQICSRIFDDARGVEVVGVETIGDVAVDEDISWLAVADGGFGDSTIGAANPQYLRTLTSSKGFEELRVLFGGPPSVDLVSGDDSF